MPYLDDGLRENWVPGLNAVARRPTGGVQNWLRTSTYQVLSHSGGTLRLYVPDPEGLLRALSFDVNRMALVAFESLGSIAAVDGFPRSVAWATVKAYYASFYAAHALLRVQGRSCTHFDIGDIVSLRRAALAYGIQDANAINAGLYRLSYEAANQTLTMEKNAGEGSHEFMWATFNNQLGNMSSTVSAGAALEKYKQEFGLALRGLGDVLTDGGKAPKGNWLSQVRNDVQYRLEYDAWYPHAKSFCFDDVRRLVSASMQMDVFKMQLKNSDEIVKAISASCFIAAMCRDTLDDMFRRCPKGRSFLYYGLSSFLRLRGSAERDIALRA